MTNKKTISDVLLDEEQALEAYLNALLQEATEAPEDIEDEEPGVEALPGQAPPESTPAVIGTAEVRDAAPPPVGDEEEVEAEEAAIQSTALVPVAADEVTLLPAWSQSSFQVLLFEVGGLPLAVPLAELNGIQTWTDEIKPMPGHSPWFLGLLNVRGTHAKVVDPYPLVVPQNRQSNNSSTKGHIVLIGENRWGLACDKVTKVMTLSKEDVQWRTSRTKRPWLLGTVKEQMCAVLDVEAFAKMLETGR